MSTLHGIEIDEFTDAYITAALWSSNDESDPSGGVPLDQNYTPSDIHPDTLRAMAEDCAKFRALVLPGHGKCTVAKLLSAIPSHKRRGEWSADELDGHDFWLTRNGHGAGFWDRDYGKVGDILTSACKSFREVNLYVGDDGKIHA
jgi:hypothetical protein